MIKFLIGLAIGATLTLFGYYTSYHFSNDISTSRAFARITIKNQSGKYVRKISLRHSHGTLEAIGLKDTEEIQFVFSNASENSYNVTVTFEDGITLSSNNIYIEQGYKSVSRQLSRKVPGHRRYLQG